jgi:hypothetical protein
MVTPAIGADADFQTGQRATFRSAQRRMKKFFSLQRSEKSDLPSMFARIALAAHTSGWSFLPKFLQIINSGRACKPDSPVNVESAELVWNQPRRTVNDVSLASVGRICVTLASQ